MSILGLLVPGTVAGAYPTQPPSFNCSKAAAATELAICRNGELAEMDAKLNKTWRRLVAGFANDEYLARLRRDQLGWVEKRNICGKDERCIDQTYRERLAMLTGASAVSRFSGVFEAARVGSISIYPFGQIYLVSIQTADPTQGKWTCEISGEGSAVGSVMFVSAGGKKFKMILKDDRNLFIAPDPEVQDAEAGACGLGGTISFRYARARN